MADSRRHEIEELAAGIPAREISGYRSSNIAVGEHALAGALRFFASGSLDREPRGEEVLRSYFRAALLNSFTVSNRPMIVLFFAFLYLRQAICKLNY